MKVYKHNYCLPRFYKSRLENIKFDDSANEDEWQLEVYLHALGLMKKNSFLTVLDVGCGSGFKLVRYLGDFQTIGLELPQNVKVLKELYPDKKWAVSDLHSDASYSADVVICSDVIEHLVNPDELLQFLLSIEFKYLIISTPARDLMVGRWSPKFYGPPKNRAHVREWTQIEFRRYIGDRFDIIDHRVTNLAQCTQMIICKKHSLM